MEASFHGILVGFCFGVGFCAAKLIFDVALGLISGRKAT